MPSRPPSDDANRLFVSAGTANFIHHSALPEVTEELERIAQAFARLGYTAQPALADPTRDQLQALFADARKNCGERGLLVGYYTGHGARADRFYLLTHESAASTQDIHLTSLAAEDLARALAIGTRAAQFLIILDVCYAGAGAAELMGVLSDLVKTLPTVPGMFVVAAARPRQEAHQTALTRALCHVLENPDERFGGRAQKYLAIDEVMGAVNDYLELHFPSQRATWSSAAVDGRCRLFPNPRYLSDQWSGLDLETRRTFEEHWVPKARGAELGGSGWYFTGRERVLQGLSTWLAQPLGDGRPRVVTGGAGSGKSALLARIVTLADNQYRKDALSSRAAVDHTAMPPAGVVDVAVHARRKMLSEVASQISAGLRIGEQEAGKLIHQIAIRGHKTVIVLDALDESDEREQIILQLLVPLAALRHVFLLIGTRPDLPTGHRRFKALGEATVEYDLNDPSNLGDDDVRLYVERRLLASEEPSRATPYRGQVRQAQQIAKAVSERANGVFLVAHTIAMALLLRPTAVDTDRSDWIAEIPTGLDEAFERFLDELDMLRPEGLTKRKVLDVLRPLALAEGEGLPWSGLWSSAASGMSMRVVVDTEIEAVRRYAAAFIVESLENDRSVYRLYHERIAEYLRASLKSPTANERLFGALMARVPTRLDGTLVWRDVHPHLKKHLATYAAKAEKLSELIGDIGFIRVAEPGPMFRHLPVVARTAPALVAAYRRVYGSMRGCSEDERGSYLVLSLLQEGQKDLAETVARESAGALWRPLWAWWSQPSKSHVIATGDATISALYAGTSVQRKPVAVVGRESGVVELWQLTDGALAARWCPFPGQRVLVVAQTAVTGTQLVIASWSNGAFGVYAPDSRGQWLERLPPDPEGELNIFAIGVVGHGADARCVCAHRDFSLSIWELPRLRLIKHRAQATGSLIYHLTQLQTSKGLRIVAAGDSVRDSSNMQFQPRLSLFTEELELVWQSPLENGCISRVETFEHKGKTLVLSSQDFWGPCEVWRPVGDKLRLIFRDTSPSGRAWIEGHSDALSLYTTHIGAIHRAPLRLPSRGRAEALPPVARLDPVRGNGLSWTDQVRIQDRPHVVSSEHDAVHVWDLHDMQDMSDPEALGRQAEIQSIRCVHVVPSSTQGEATRIFVGCGTGEVISVDAETGVIHWSYRASTKSGVAAVCGYLIGQRQHLVVAAGGALHRMTADEPTELGAPIQAGEMAIRLSVVLLEGRQAVLASVEQGRVWAIRAWDLQSGAEIALKPDWPDSRWLYQLSHGEEDKRITCLVSTVRGDATQMAFASKYAQVMVARDVKGGSGRPRWHKPFETWTIPGSIQEQVTALALSDEGEFLIAGTMYGLLAVWDFRDGELIAHRADTHFGKDINCVACGKAGNEARVISGGTDGALRFWTLQLEPVCLIKIGETIVDIALHDNSHRLVVVTPNGLVQIELTDSLLWKYPDSKAEREQPIESG